MKKIVLLTIAILLAAPVFAGLEAGQHLVGARLGLGFQLQNSGITYSNYEDRVNWGSLGSELGLSYYYLLTPYWGLGADVSYGDFEGTNLTWSNSNIVDDQTHLVNLMLSTRLTANPSNPVRIYFPLGAGWVSARQDLSVRYHGINYNKKKTDTSFGYFIGAGLEFDLGRSSGWALGIEGRYHTFWYDTDKLVSGAPAPITGDGNRRYEYLTFNLSVMKRF